MRTFTRTKPRPARWTACLGGLLVLVFSSGLAVAPPGSADPAAPEEEATPSKLVLVMDSSGSMKEAAGGGQTRIQAAKTALDQVIGSLPADQEVGLRVFGAEVFSRTDAGACQDSQLVVPVATDNREDLRRAVASYEPYGETPTGYALEQAGRDLGDEGERNIVLVSDGEPTCEPDPCLVAKKLTADGIALRIDVVGLAVSGSARQTLQCVADAGGGVYYDAGTADELVQSLTRVAERSARGYREVGQPVIGAASVADAPVITAGDWVDVVETTQPERHYLVRRELQDSTIFVSAAYRSPREDGASFNRIRLETPDGDACGSGAEVEQLATGVLVASSAIAGPFDTFGDVATDNPCLTSRELVAVVDYSGESSDTPVEIRVTEVPALADAAALPAPTEEVTWSQPDGGNRSEVAGGTSFVDPEPLTPGSYRGTIVPGETLTFATDVEWGQQLDVRAELAAAAGPLQPASDGSPLTMLELYNPARGAAGSTEADATLFGKTFLNPRNPQELGQTTGAINFANIASNAYRGASLAGSYTITLALEDTEENASLPVPFELDVAVVGDAQPGPEFDERPFDDETPSASPSAEPTEDDVRAAPESEQGSSALTWILAALGLTAVAVGSAVLMRRKSAEES